MFYFAKRLVKFDIRFHFLKTPYAQAAFDATYGAGGGIGGNYPMMLLVGLRSL